LPPRSISLIDVLPCPGACFTSIRLGHRFRIAPSRDTPWLEGLELLARFLGGQRPSKTDESAAAQGKKERCLRTSSLGHKTEAEPWAALSFSSITVSAKPSSTCGDPGRSAAGAASATLLSRTARVAPGSHFVFEGLPPRSSAVLNLCDPGICFSADRASARFAELLSAAFSTPEPSPLEPGRHHEA
jgi:hypothetical protein